MIGSFVVGFICGAVFVIVVACIVAEEERHDDYMH